MTSFLIFDLDGTLSDPAEGVMHAINYSLRHFQYPEITSADISACIGPPIDQTFARLSGARDATHVAALVAKYRERYAQTGYAENVLYPGIPELLETLTARGIPMGVCTSKRVDFAERILSMFSLRTHFRFVSGGEDGASKTEHLADLLKKGQVPSHAVMIGDRAVDVVAARSNGLIAAGVLWGHGSEAELRNASAHHVFAEPHALLQLVETGSPPSVSD